MPCMVMTRPVGEFTGKERDSETGLHFFGARYMSAAQGRFTSPDPGNVSGLGHIDDPQSWNGYAYVRNNRLRYTDPDRLETFFLFCLPSHRP